MQDSHLDFPVVSRLGRVAEAIAAAASGASGAQPLSPQLQPWHLLRFMLREGPGVGLDCYRDVVQRRRSELDLLLATGVMQYLQQAQLQLMKRFIAANPAIANLRGDPGIIPTVQAFLNVKLRMWPRSVQDWYNASSPRVDGHPLWPQVFFCLRCGGRREALQLVHQAQRQARLPAGIADALAAFVAVMDRREAASVQPGGGADSSAGAGVRAGAALLDAAKPSAPLPAAAGAAVNSVKSHYDDLTRGSSGPAVDPFHQEVACLLGYADPGVLDELVLPTMKDFVWHRLFFAITAELGQARAEHAGGGAALAHMGGPGAAGMELYTVPRLAHEILQTWRGAEHFDKGHRKPYQYFQMLLQINRPELAIDYLAQHGHVQNRSSHFEDAVHFALALHLYGALRTTPFTPPSARGAGAGAGAGVGAAGAAAGGAAADGVGFVTTVSGFAGAEEEQLDLWSLVNVYVTTQLASEPKAAADYICLLDDAHARRHFLVDLLTRTRQYDPLLGPLTESMQPTKGHLHNCLSDAGEVLAIITDAARTAKDQGYFADALVLLCRLPQPLAVYDVLNSQLAAFLQPTPSAAAGDVSDAAYSASRRQWRMYAENILNRR